MKEIWSLPLLRNESADEVEDEVAPLVTFGGFVDEFAVPAVFATDKRCRAWDWVVSDDKTSTVALKQDKNHVIVSVIFIDPKFVFFDSVFFTILGKFFKKNHLELILKDIWYELR